MVSWLVSPSLRSQLSILPAGMNYEGIYRKTGGMGQTKLITQFFERGQDFDLEDLDKFNDLAAITSCLKNFFRCLPVPLFTHELHEEFVSCSGSFACSSSAFIADLSNITQKCLKERLDSLHWSRPSTSCQRLTSSPLAL